MLNQTIRAAVLTLAVAGFLAPPATGQTTDPQGFIYGKITSRSGTVYQGRLRWDDEEAFWGDFFNSAKSSREYLEEVPDKYKRHRKPIEVLGIRIGVTWEDEVSRQFIARFGDLKSLKIEGGDRVQATMKNGSQVALDGGSNDIGAKVVVWDPNLGEVELQWKKIDTIEFLPTPKGLQVPVFRLIGTVKTTSGEFRGPIQWDQQECLSSDELDGETEDGDLSLKMGTIRSIEKRSRSSSRVILRDGRELVLSDTNDVDSSNRGVYVEDARYGRVLIEWEAFERADFAEPGPSGPSYDAFAPGKGLAGKVTDEDGTVHRGKIIFDLDEKESWESLDGDRRDIEYHIPFGLVAAIERAGSETIAVRLKGGESLELSDTTDTGDGHAGVLVLSPGAAEPRYLPWEEVDKIEFD